jgi:hypothetical protein
MPHRWSRQNIQSLQLCSRCVQHPEYGPVVQCHQLDISGLQPRGATIWCLTCRLSSACPTYLSSPCRSSSLLRLRSHQGRGRELKKSCCLSCRRRQQCSERTNRTQTCERALCNICQSILDSTVLRSRLTWQSLSPCRMGAFLGAPREPF